MRTVLGFFTFLLMISYAIFMVSVIALIPTIGIMFSAKRLFQMSVDFWGLFILFFSLVAFRLAYNSISSNRE
jgi:hypothetical protein